jgi:hypothetical protein
MRRHPDHPGYVQRRERQVEADDDQPEVQRPSVCQQPFRLGNQ